LYFELDSDEDEIQDLSPAAYLTQGTAMKFTPDLATEIMEDKEISESEEKLSKSQSTFKNSKPALNRRTRRRLARDIVKESYQTRAVTGEIVELNKHMARPPGCSFLGSKATQTMASIGGLSEEPIKVIIDSGSDITLISEAALDQLTVKPKVKTGQKIKLIQVTGTSSISGFVTLDVYFYSEEGPIKLTVEAYVVKGMTTPFLLGNDFSDQYSISTIREAGETRLSFGGTGRSIFVESSTGNTLSDNQGHAFQIRTLPELQSNLKHRNHRRNQKYRQKSRKRKLNGEVRAVERVIIPAMSSKAIRVETQLTTSSGSIFVERKLLTSKGGRVMSQISQKSRSLYLRVKS